MRRSISVFLVAVLATAFGTAASAAVIYETDYTTRTDNGNPFNDGGELRFQDQWLGQTGYIVDSDAPGTVTGSGGFLRTLQGRGATGGTAGGDGSGEVGTGFNDGDTMKITIALQYDLLTSANQALSSVGVRPNFVNGGFNASPTSGFKVAYNSFGEGSLKVFTNFARQGFVGADNAFAVFVTGPEAGFDSGGTGGTVDLVTDNLEFEYSAVFNAGSWQATDMIVRNLDNGGAIVADAAAENAAALEAEVYAGTEAFFGQRLTDTTGAQFTSDYMRFEFTAVPEPASLALLGLASCGLLGMRRRNG